MQREMYNYRRVHRAHLVLLAGAAAVAAFCVVFMATLAANSSAATTVAPDNTAEPRITGTPRVGQVQRATRGTWTGTAPITYEFRWFRCDGAGAPDASDCRRISNASDNTYVARQADAGFRLRVQVVARNADGQDTATSNPTAVITAAAPVNTRSPRSRGTRSSGPACRRTAASGPDSSRSPTRTSGCAATTRATTAARSRVRTTRTTRSATATSAGRSAFALSPGTTGARRRRSRIRPVSSARTSPRLLPRQLGAGGGSEGGR